MHWEMQAGAAVPCWREGSIAFFANIEHAACDMWQFHDRTDLYLYVPKCKGFLSKLSSAKEFALHKNSYAITSQFLNYFPNKTLYFQSLNLKLVSNADKIGNRGYKYFIDFFEK